jgi:hypothetical protein
MRTEFADETAVRLNNSETVKNDSFFIMNAEERSLEAKE